MTSEELQIKLAALGDPNSQVDLLNQYAWENFSSNPKEAIFFASKSLELARQSNNLSGIAFSERNFAAASWLLGNNADALLHAQSALTLFEEINEEEGQADILTIFAAIYGSWSEYEQALEYQLKALYITDKTGNIRGTIKALFNIGAVYFVLAQYEMALEYQQKCLNLAEETGDVNHIAASLTCIGDIFLKKKEIQLALEYQLKALEAASTINSQYDLANIFQNVGTVYTELGQYEKAGAYLQESLDIFEKIGNKGGIAKTHFQLGDLFGYQERYDLTFNEYKAALELAVEIHSEDLVFQIHEAYSKIYEKLSDFQSSLHHFKLYSEIKNAVLNSENQRAVARLQIRYDVEKTQREREIYRLRNVELDKANLEIANLNKLLQNRVEAVMRELQIGRQIQADFLPEALPEMNGWEIDARFKPAREVSGDFYDVFLLSENRVGLVIADVCDKGVGAALFMALTRSLIRVLALQASIRLNNSGLGGVGSGRLLIELPPFKTGQASLVLPAATVEVLNSVQLANNYIAANHSRASMFATLFFGVLDIQTGSLCYINGGHDAPIHLCPEGVKERLTLTGPAVGVLEEAIYKIKQVQLERGDTLLAYTDGVPEAHSLSSNLFTEKRFLDLLEKCRVEGVKPTGILLDRIMAEVEVHTSGADPSDDITILALKRLN